MATRKKPQAENKVPDALIVGKANFLSKLLERVELGKELIDKKVTNVEELDQNEKDFYKWNDYNSEYLKQSFNNEDNEYKVHYDRVNSFSILRIVYFNHFQKSSSPHVSRRGHCGLEAESPLFAVFNLLF